MPVVHAASYKKRRLIRVSKDTDPVSKHIRILERAELVRRRVSGREHFLSFNPAPMESAAEWMERHRIFWTERLDALEAALRAEDAVAAAKEKSTQSSNRRSKK